MKKIILFTLITITCGIQSSAQSVAINKGKFSPNASAIKPIIDRNNAELIIADLSLPGEVYVLTDIDGDKRTAKIAPCQ